jgi:hypothetical protein
MSVEFRSYDKLFVQEIIFGCKVSLLEINKARKQLKACGFNLSKIKLKQMKIDEKTFLLKETTL